MTLGGVDLRPYVVFNITIRTNRLAVIPYSAYQVKLHGLIVQMREDGLSYNAIADYLNKNGLKTPRGKSFRNAHAHSIIKKKRIRDERLERHHVSDIENFDLLYF